MDEQCEMAIKRLRRRFGIEEKPASPAPEPGSDAAQLARRYRIDHARYISSPVYRGNVDAAYPGYSRALRKGKKHGGKEKTGG